MTDRGRRLAGWAHTGDSRGHLSQDCHQAYITTQLNLLSAHLPFSLLSWVLVSSVLYYAYCTINSFLETAFWVTQPMSLTPNQIHLINSPEQSDGAEGLSPWPQHTDQPGPVTHITDSKLWHPFPTRGPHRLKTSETMTSNVKTLKSWICHYYFKFRDHDAWGSWTLQAQNKRSL